MKYMLSDIMRTLKEKWRPRQYYPNVSQNPGVEYKLANDRRYKTQRISPDMLIQREESDFKSEERRMKNEE